jgi:hypothetical protein
MREQPETWKGCSVKRVKGPPGKVQSTIPYSNLRRDLRVRRSCEVKR